MASTAQLAVRAPFAGVVVAIPHAGDEPVEAGSVLVVLEAMKMEHEVIAETSGVIGERADLRAVRERHELGLDAGRPEAVARRHERGRRTARENLAELVDEGTFVEYGPLLFAAQERRRSREELITRTPADGLIGGIGEIDGRRCVAMSYDYTVLAGTQGVRNHQKKDR